MTKVLYEKDGRIARITLNRPQVMNAIDDEVPALLEEGLYHVDGQVANEVYVYGSFLQSAMYHAGVTCSDCQMPRTASCAM